MDPILRYPNSISSNPCQRSEEKYDVVHLRFFMTVASDDNVDVVIENLKGMLSG